MTDTSDHATEMEDLSRQVALRAQQQRAGLAGKTVSDSATDCDDCGEAIPYVRRAAIPGCQRCVECQGAREKAFYER